MTIQEVARLAGVSVATVSRVLNGSPLVKDDTREKVMSVIRKFDYQPNLQGRALRRSETMKVLVLTPRIDWPFFADVVQGLEDRAKQDGYYVLVCPTSNHKNREEELFQMLQNKLADGVITFSSTLTEEKLSALGQKYSIVQCCEIKEASFTCAVSIDDEAAAYDAVRHFIEAGHRDIALIGGPSNINSTHLRLQGYRRALAQYDIPVRKEWIKLGDGRYDDGVALTNELLQLSESPSAIFCLNDSVAVGCVNAIKINGRTVPDEIAVIGFDNTREATMSLPALTTVHQPKYDLGYTAMNLLIHNMTSEDKNYERVTLPHRLVERESTSRG
ncbi:hypothetical protein XI25_11350 [Paenibacillus sp. DMB20]|nr:hypothetical protein XI25_11350 [Paenibacillus sp. DMB20]